MGCGSSSKRGAKAQVLGNATSCAEKQDFSPRGLSRGDEATEEGGAAGHPASAPQADAARLEAVEQLALIPQIIKKVAVIRVQAEQYRSVVQQEIISIEQEVLENLQGSTTAGVENGVVMASYSPEDEEAAGTGVMEGLEGEALEIIVKDAGGWAYCRKQGHETPGWLPSTRVAELAMLKADHQGQDSQEATGLLTLKKGDMVEVINRHYSGWTFCREWNGPPLPGVPSERKEGWVTDTYLEDRRSQAMLASKWHRLVLQALDQVVASGRELELFLGQAATYMDDVKGLLDPNNEWLHKCLEFAAWLSAELQSITAAVKQHEKTFVVVQGCKAVASRSAQAHDAHQLAYEEGAAFVVVDAKHADWIWCRREDGSAQGWVLRSNLVFEEKEPSESDSGEPSLVESSPRIAACQDSLGQALGLPKWVKVGARCRWWSSSGSRYCSVVVQTVDIEKQEVRVVFLSDEAYWKVVGFDHFDLPRSEWILVPDEIAEKERELRDQLPEWVIEGCTASWWSASQNRCMPVQIFEVNFKRRMVGASFKQDPSVKKFVPFHQLIDDPESCFLKKDSSGHRQHRRSATQQPSPHGGAGRGSGRPQQEAARAEPAAETAGGEAHGLPERQVDEADTMMRQTMGQLLKEMQQDLGDMLGPGEASCEATTAEADPRGQPRSGSVEPGGPHGAAAEAELAQEGTPMGKLLQEMQHSFGDDAPVPGLGARALRPVPPAFADAAADEPQGAPAAQELPPETPGQLLRAMERDFDQMLGQEPAGPAGAEPPAAAGAPTAPAGLSAPAAPAGAAAGAPGGAAGQAASPAEWPAERPAATPPRGEGPAPPQGALQAALGLMEKAPQPLADDDPPQVLPGGSAVADPVDDLSAPPAAAAAGWARPAQESFAGRAAEAAVARGAADGWGGGAVPPPEWAESLATAAQRHSDVADSPGTVSTLGQAERELEQMTEASIDLSACAEVIGGGRNTRSTPGGLSTLEAMEETSAEDDAALGPQGIMKYSESEEFMLETLGRTVSKEQSLAFETLLEEPLVAAAPTAAARGDDGRAPSGGGRGEDAAEAQPRGSGGSKGSAAAAAPEDEWARMQGQSGLLRQAVSLIQPSAWGADSGGEGATVPDAAQLAMEWPQLEEELAAATEAEDKRAAAEAELKLQARVRTVDSHLAELQRKLEEQAQAAEQKLNPQEAQRYRTMSWEVVQMAEAARDKRVKNKEALLGLRPQKAARRRKALREALDMEDFGGDGGNDVPQMPTLGRATLSGLSLADAIGEAAELTSGIFRTLQVAARSRKRRRRHDRDGKAPAQGWASNSPSAVGQPPRLQDPSQRELQGKCQAALDSFEKTLGALMWRLEQEHDTTTGASRELELLARGEEGLSREQKREKAMFEGQQDYDWERSHDIHVRERAERQERAFASALALAEEQLRGEWRSSHERERAQSLVQMGRLREHLQRAEAEIDDIEQQHRKQLEEEENKLELDRRRIHDQMQVLVAAAAVIRQLKSKMDEVYYSDKKERQEVSIRCLRKVRRLNRDLKLFAASIVQEVKQQHSVLLYSLRMLEARLVKECPNSDHVRAEDGDLETAEVKKQRDEANQAFEDQLARDLQNLRQSHRQRSQRLVRNVAARYRAEVEREELPDALRAAHVSLEESLREGALVDLAVAALRPFAKSAALLEVESFRHSEVEDSPFEPAAFGPKPKRLAAAAKATASALRAALASAGEARGALSGDGLVAKQDGEWSEKLAEAEGRWQAFLEAHPEAEGYAASDDGCETPRCQDSLAQDSSTQVLELEVDDLDEDPAAGGVAGQPSQGGARAGPRRTDAGPRGGRGGGAVEGPPSPGPSPRPDRPGRAPKGAGRPRGGAAAGPGAPKGGPPRKGGAAARGPADGGPPGAAQRAPPGGPGAAKLGPAKHAGATELLAQLDDLSKTMDLALGGPSSALDRARSKAAAPPPPRKGFAAPSAAPPPGRSRPPPPS